MSGAPAEGRVVPAQVHAYSLVAGLVQVLIVAGLLAFLLPEPRVPGTS